MAKGLVLIADTDAGFVSGLKTFLSSEGYSSLTAGDPRRVLEACDSQAIDVILISREMVRDCPGDLIAKVRQLTDAAIFQMSDFGDKREEDAKAGYEVLVKPFSHHDLGMILRLAFNNRRLAEEIASLRMRRRFQDELVMVAGKGKHLEELVSSLERATSDGSAVLLQGERGTERETVARIIHSNYFGNSGSFVSVSCQTLTEEGILRKLFGSSSECQGFLDRGRTKGKVEFADGGTLFIDGIECAPPSVQIRLLNLIAERGFETGTGEWVSVSTSIVAGASADLEQMVEADEFRADLLCRLQQNVVTIKPLREIRDALPEIVQSAIESCSAGENSTTGVDADAARLLYEHTWPGNHQELVECIKSAAARCQNGLISPHHLPAEITDGAEIVEMLSNALEAVEKRHISSVLEKCQWNKHQAARELEISKSTLYSKIGKYRLTQKGPADSPADAGCR